MVSKRLMRLETAVHEILKILARRHGWKCGDKKIDFELLTPEEAVIIFLGHVGKER